MSSLVRYPFRGPAGPTSPAPHVVKPGSTPNNTYHVSNVGSNAADGLTPATAWQTLAKVNGFTFAAGDSVLLRRGDRWKETLTIPRNSLYIGAHGVPAVFDADGYNTNAPVIDGGEYVTGWTAYTGGVSDSYYTDDFAGTSGANVTTSTPEVGAGSWSMVTADNDGALVISSDGMARRSDTTHFSQYIAGTAPARTDYYVTTTIKVKTLLTLDLAYNVVHQNPSGQGTRTYVFSAFLQNAGVSSLRVGTFVNGVLNDFHDLVLSNFVAGQTYTLKSVKQGAILYTYIDDVLTDTYDFSGNLVGTFQTGAASVGIRLGGATATLEIDSTGMQVDSFDCGPLGAPGTPVNTYQATLALNPLIVDFRGSYSFEGASVNLLNNNEYSWNANGKLYVRSDSGAPSNTDVVAATRDNGVLGGATTGITLQDIAVEHTRDHSIYWSSGSGATLRSVMVQISSGGAGQNGTIAFNGHSGLTVDRCVVRNCGSDAVYMNTCPNFRIAYCRLGEVYGQGADCIQHDGSGTINGYIGNNYLFGSQESPKGLVILQNGTDFTIENNYFVATHNFHVALIVSNVTVRGNVFYRCQASTPGAGGGLEITDNTATAFTNVVAHHNVFIDCNPAINIWGSNNDSANRSAIKFYNNTIINFFIAPTEWQVNFQSPVSGEFQDNIIWDFTGTAKAYQLASIIGAQTWVSDYNIIGPELTDFIHFTGTFYATLAAYVAGKSEDAHSFVADPLLWNPGGPEAADHDPIVGSPVTGAGVSIPGINTTLTIGAREPRAATAADNTTKPGAGMFDPQLRQKAWF
jgi:hypothetical protein